MAGPVVTKVWCRLSSARSFPPVASDGTVVVSAHCAVAFAECCCVYKQCTAVYLCFRSMTSCCGGSGSKLIMVLDLGTTFFKCTIFRFDPGEGVCLSDSTERVATPSLNILRTSRMAAPTLYPLLEIDPQLFLRTIVTHMRKSLDETCTDWSDLSCVGICSQRNTFMLTNQSGEPYHNFISWKDVRAVSIADGWNQSLLSRAVRTIGWAMDQVMDWSFGKIMSAIYFRSNHVLPRLKLILDNIPNLKQKCKDGTARLALMDSWLLHQLSEGGAYKVDISTASATGLFNPATR